MSGRGRGGDRGGRGGGRGGDRGGRGGGRGGRGGDRGGRGGGRGGRGGKGDFMNEGPPETLEEMGSFSHVCENEMVFRSMNKKIPKFNAPIWFENKTEVGKLDEIFGPINEVYFTVKPHSGIVPSSFKVGDKVFIGPDRLLNIEMFIEENKPKTPGGRGGNRGGSRGGSRGGNRGGSRGGSRGGNRGGISKGGNRGGNRGGSRGGNRGGNRGGSRGKS